MTNRDRQGRFKRKRRRVRVSVLAATLAALTLAVTGVTVGVQQHRKLAAQQATIKKQGRLLNEQTEMLGQVVEIQVTQRNAIGALLKNQKQLVGIIRMQVNNAKQEQRRLASFGGP